MNVHSRHTRDQYGNTRIVFDDGLVLDISFARNLARVWFTAAPKPPEPAIASIPAPRNPMAFSNVLAMVA